MRPWACGSDARAGLNCIALVESRPCLWRLVCSAWGTTSLTAGTCQLPADLLFPSLHPTPLGLGAAEKEVRRRRCRIKSIKVLLRSRCHLHAAHALLLQAIDEEEGVAAVKAAFDRGINFFDTSPFYGDTRSETVGGWVLGVCVCGCVGGGGGVGGGGVWVWLWVGGGWGVRQRKAGLGMHAALLCGASPGRCSSGRCPCCGGRHTRGRACRLSPAAPPGQPPALWHVLHCPLLPFSNLPPACPHRLLPAAPAGMCCTAFCPLSAPCRLPAHPACSPCIR